MFDLSLSRSDRDLLYPQREPEQASWLDEQLNLMWRGLKAPFGRHLGRFRWIGEIDRASTDKVKEMDDEALNRRAGSIGQELARQSGDRALIRELFMLIGEACRRELGLVPHPEQRIAALAMLDGRIIEMDTGEGKTLAAVIAAACAALRGVPVHVITANDYLAARDAEQMGPVFGRLGLTTGVVVAGDPSHQRRAAYRQNVCYCSGKEITFDYLRDRLAISGRNSPLSLRIEHLTFEQDEERAPLLNGLHFAIIDEADAILADEARTPLVISRTTPSPEVERLYHQAIALAADLRQGRDFLLDTRTRGVELTQEGLRRAAQSIEQGGEAYGGIWQGPRRRAELLRKALAALHLYRNGEHYILRDGKVCIVDENTGRVLPDRSWEQGLHQMIEAAEGVAITAPRETLARTSYQSFFGRYLHLAGMSGTVREISGELRQIYHLERLAIPRHKPLAREHKPTQVFARAAALDRALLEEVKRLHAQGLPILIGTRSVAASEALSQLLSDAGLDHRVLNARQDRQEAEIIAQAGERGSITLATSMAGRGTDIRLGSGVAELGGLQVIGVQLQDARRIDRQLAGRSARQGDPGSYRLFVSLEDQLAEQRLPRSERRLLQLLLAFPGGGRLALARLRMAQQGLERTHRKLRLALVRSNRHLADGLAFAGKVEA